MNRSPTLETASHVPEEAAPFLVSGTFESPQGIRWRLAVILVSLAVVGTASLLEIRGERRVQLPGEGWTVPELCTYHRLTGYDCPGCGMTRSFISMAHGQWQQAWHYHPFGSILFLYIAAQVPFQTWQIMRLRRGRALLRVEPWHSRLVIAFLILFLGFAIWRLLGQVHEIWVKL